MLGVLTATCLCLCGIVQAEATAPDLSGTWKGVAVISDRGEDEVVVELERRPDGWAGTAKDAMGLISPQPLRNVKFEKNTLTLEITGADENTSFTVWISLVLQGNTLSGTWRHEADQGAVRLTRQPSK